ncbi:putative reverse transcriptase domain-containing protein [Tanacetum coccineum]
MSMTIQSSVKDKILATSSETSKVENTPAEMLRDLDQQMEKRADDGKANAVTEALRRKERVKPRRVRAMAMTIQFGARGMILAVQSEAFKQENVRAERLHGKCENDDHGRKLTGQSTALCNPRAIKMYHDLREMTGGREPKRGYLLKSLTKSAHFLAIREDYSTRKLAKIYTDEIVARHGVPVSIISDRDGRFTSRCWQTVQKALGMRLDISMLIIPKRMGKEPVELWTDVKSKTYKIRCEKFVWRFKRGPESLGNASDYMNSKYHGCYFEQLIIREVVLEAFVGYIWEAKHQVSFMRILRLREVARMTARIALEFAPEFVYVYLDDSDCGITAGTKEVAGLISSLENDLGKSISLPQSLEKLPKDFSMEVRELEVPILTLWKIQGQ